MPAERINKLEELRSAELVRGEFTSSVFAPKMTVAYNSFTYNQSCIDFMKAKCGQMQYMHMLVFPEKMQLIVLPLAAYQKNAIKWSYLRKKDSRLSPRIVKSNGFCETLYQYMHWSPEVRYKIQADFQDVEGQLLVVFPLVEYEQFVSEEVTLDNGKKVLKRKVYLPKEWQKSFGGSYGDYIDGRVIDIKTVDILNNSTDRFFWEPEIKGKAMSTEDILVDRYGGKPSE